MIAWWPKLRVPRFGTERLFANDWLEPYRREASPGSVPYDRYRGNATVERLTHSKMRVVLKVSTRPEIHFDPLRTVIVTTTCEVRSPDRRVVAWPSMILPDIIVVWLR